MPLICSHLTVAAAAAGALALPILEKERASYFLGAAAPDMSALRRQPREETHFLRYGAEPGESGVRNILASGSLAESSSLLEGTAAFVAGYMTHLLCDEIWYFDIMKQFFAGGATDGYGSSLGERVLACKLEIRDRQDQGKVQSFRAHLATADPDVASGVVDTEALGQWRDRVRSAMEVEPSWPAFRPFLQRYLPPEDQDRPESYDRFVEGLPGFLEGVIQRVGPERIRKFRRDCVEKSIEAVGGYLG